MRQEKEQLIALACGVGLMLLVVVLFVVLGGELNLLLFSFSVESPLANYGWVVPIVIILLQQGFLLPRYIKKYWSVVSTDEPGILDIWVPFTNEGRLMGGIKEVIYYALWGICVFMVLLAFTPLMQLMGAGLDTGTYILIVAGVVLLAIISIYRGIIYMGIRKDIYELHNKYLGKRRGGMTYVFAMVCYFVPLLRCVSLALDLQLLEKLTTFNDVANMSVDLEEE